MRRLLRSFVIVVIAAGPLALHMHTGSAQSKRASTGTLVVEGFATRRAGRAPGFSAPTRGSR